MVRLLRQTAEFAEHVEQTGSFQSGARNSVKRYNAIVEHLEEEDIIREDMFPRLEEDESDFGQLGAEATALANYLDDIGDEEEKPATGGPKGKDFGWLLGLAPFLERDELSKLVRSHFTGQAPFPVPPAPPKEEADSSQGPDLKTIIGLAPHIDKKTLGEMVRACLSRQKLRDPNLLVALAPHMESRDLGQILHEYLPDWFASASPEAAPPAEPPAPKQEIVRSEWGTWSATGVSPFPNEGRPEGQG
jgi:hypothetical protein